MKQLHLFIKEDTLKPKRKQKNITEIINEANPPLGPESKQIGYDKYIKSESWANKRAFALYKANYTCQHCKEQGKNLEVHHKHYDTLYRERLNDVEVLCKSCHSNADRRREYFTAYETWVYKKYGDRHDLDSEWLQREFDEWYNRACQYDDCW